MGDYEYYVISRTHVEIHDAKAEMKAFKEKSIPWSVWYEDESALAEPEHIEPLHKFTTDGLIFEERAANYSEGGNLLHVMKPDQLTLDLHYARDNYRLLRTFKSPYEQRLRDAFYSPCEGLIVLVCYRIVKTETPNVFVFSTHSGDLLLEHHVVSRDYKGWQPIYFTTNYAVLGLPNGYRVFQNYRAQGLKNFEDKEVPNLLTCSIGADTLVLCTLDKADPQKPGNLSLVSLSTGSTICSLDFYNANEPTFKWSHDFKYCLVTLIRENSKTAYMGTNNLFLLHENGFVREIGQAADFWPEPTRFYYINSHEECVIGNPDNGAVLMSFSGTKRRHTYVQPSAGGVLTLLGGFGNLSGDIEIWESERKKKIGVLRLRYTNFCQWSPTRQFFIAASMAPRMKVDNFLHFISYDGLKILYSRKFPEGELLYASKFRFQALSQKSNNKVPLLKDTDLNLLARKCMQLEEQFFSQANLSNQQRSPSVRFTEKPVPETRWEPRENRPPRHPRKKREAQQTQPAPPAPRQQQPRVPFVPPPVKKSG